jgi:hypothetical protein
VQVLGGGVYLLFIRLSWQVEDKAALRACASEQRIIAGFLRTTTRKEEDGQQQ